MSSGFRSVLNGCIAKAEHDPCSRYGVEVFTPVVEKGEKRMSKVKAKQKAGKFMSKAEYNTAKEIAIALENIDFCRAFGKYITFVERFRKINGIPV